VGERVSWALYSFTHFRPAAGCKRQIELEMLLNTSLPYSALDAVWQCMQSEVKSNS